MNFNFFNNSTTIALISCVTAATASQYGMGGGYGGMDSNMVNSISGPPNNLDAGLQMGGMTGMGPMGMGMGMGM